MPTGRLSSIFTSNATSSFRAPSPQPRAPLAALAAATERVCAGTLRPEEAHHLFDELLSQAAAVPVRGLNNFLAALARAPPSSTCSDGPGLAIALFNRMSQGAGARVVSPTLCTYSILMDCCCRAGRPDLVVAFFGRLIRLGLRLNVIPFNNLLKGLCKAKRSNEALDLLLHRMPELDCAPDVFSYSIVINGCFKEGEVDKACNLFHGMIQLGVQPNVVIYTSIIDALSKCGAMDKAEVVFRQMVDKGIGPDVMTCTSLIHGYSISGRWKAAVRVFKEMISLGVVPDTVMWNLFVDSLCKHRRTKEARVIFDSMAAKGQKPDTVSYSIMLNGYVKEGCFDDMTGLFNSMLQNGVVPNHHIFNILINAYAKRGLMDEAMHMFEVMRGNKE
uniref:Pentatricopeptide repeat-containing protein n=1 Tax=Aegilops tauschii subsp. strangulata TaxID=200361 RepID=A0A453DAX1_AEGTS